VAGSACPADTDPCTADVCDAVGTCTHPDNNICPRCGNLRLDPGEECDDGNVVDGDCCSASCQFEPAGQACTDDGSVCTTEECDGVGTCLTRLLPCDPCEACDAAAGCVPAPRTSCKRPTAAGAALLSVRDKPVARRDRVLWRWRKGEATSPADFADPLNLDDYAFCVYAEGAPTPLLLMRARAPADGRCGPRPCWSGRLHYRDPLGTPDGLAAIVLRPGSSGRARVTVRGRGSNLQLPFLPVVLPLRVQLQAENGACWEAIHDPSGPGRNDGIILRLRGE
jgi:cysteine-rich repeat protein